jgi:dCTP diphosphatase
VGEIGEVAELIQWKSDGEIEQFLQTAQGRERMSEEIADVFIYLIRLAQKSGIDLVEATFSKIALNESKYPIEVSRGSATKYSER